jgi:arginase family enzyme
MDIQLLLVPYDTARRGWRSGAGPEHLLQAGLTAHLQNRGHSVADIQVIEADSDQRPAEISNAFELMRGVAVAVRSVRAAGQFPVVLSGNCNSAVGTLSGLTPARRAIFWFDAHADCNIPDTTLTGFLDGTGLATALGLCWHQLSSTVSPRATRGHLLVGGPRPRSPRGEAAYWIGGHRGVNHSNPLPPYGTLGPSAIRGCPRIPSLGSRRAGPSWGGPSQLLARARRAFG